MDGTRNKRGQTLSIVLKFGNFMLNETERRLLHNGRFLDIKPKTFEVLLYLAENAGRTVTKDQILEDVWEGNFVEESNLAVHISRIRKIFDTVGEGDVISTIPGSGYRFVANVEDSDEKEWAEASSNAGPFLDPFNAEDTCESIAVMPLLNENGDEEIDYLADGITEALINTLSCRPNLRVLARNTVFRFKNENVDVVDVGRRLNVTNVMTGRIRVINDNIALGVELSSASDGEQIWGAQFNRSFTDIFELQEAITNSICENLNAEIDRASRRSPNQKHTQNTESYRLYLKGKHFLSNRRSALDLTKAESLFQNSIAQDPGFAAAYVELANCFRVQFLYQMIARNEAIDRISSLLSRAHEINPTLSSYYVAKGYYYMFLEFDFRAAEVQFNRAVTLDPGSAKARTHLARLFIYTGRVAKGLQIASQGARLDPVSYANDKNLAKIFLMSRQYENAIFRLEECLELSPDDFEALVLSGFAFTEMKRYELALDCYKRALAIQNHSETVAMRGYTYAVMNREDKARESLKSLEAMSKSISIPKTFFAVIYSGLGDLDNAFANLEEALSEKYLDLVALRVDPRWDKIRNHPRFHHIVEQVGV